jgi:hypothetical protein
MRKYRYEKIQWHLEPPKKYRATSDDPLDPDAASKFYYWCNSYTPKQKLEMRDWLDSEVMLPLVLEMAEQHLFWKINSPFEYNEEMARLREENPAPFGHVMVMDAP